MDGPPERQKKFSEGRDIEIRTSRSSEERERWTSGVKEECHLTTVSVEFVTTSDDVTPGIVSTHLDLLHN